MGRIGYAAGDMIGLDDAGRQDLATLTAFALASADARLEELARPFVERDLRSLVLQRAALEVGAAAAGLDEDSLRAVYEADPRHELTVRHLVVMAERWRPEAQRDSARERAAEALARARAGEDFLALVAEYSDEVAAAERGGLLQPGREGSWVHEFWDAASQLEPGQLSDVVETEYGFHLIRLEGREPIPFEDARDHVLEDRVSLARALEHSARWIEERTRGASVDTVAIEAWRDDRDPGRPLVRWSPGGPTPYEAEDLDAYVRTLPAGTAALLREGPIEAAVDAVEAAARNAILIEHGRELGVEPTSVQRALAEERWVGRLSGWAQALGFAAGQADRMVRERALAALDAHRQDVMIARREVLGLAPALRDLYPVREATTAGARTP